MKPAISRKRKQPPTFQHFPAERAKKLKRDWVEKKKITSKWKHEKNKDESLQQRSLLPVQEPLDEPTIVPVAQVSHAAKTDVNLEDVPDSRSTTHFSPPEISEKPRTAQQLVRGDSFRSSQPRQGPELDSSLGDHRGLPKARRGVRGKNAGFRGRVVTTRAKGNQPDMRAKMGSLLEKIQKNNASR